MERVLVLVRAEPLPPQSNYRGVVDPDEEEDEEGDEVGHCNVSPARRVSFVVEERRESNAPEPGAANGLDREYAERIARG